MIVKMFYFSWLQMLMVLKTYDRKYMGNLNVFFPLIHVHISLLILCCTVIPQTMVSLK